ncbi:hypothetical protein BpHYR1_020222 [Brachionus plicatilis]|uniref:Uncharacterized protein n=1 Tax=Brachionus plicatilis TaxID=10195 RepID=A0A3M7RI67_BRAPC|nr:hypothetical protein BpHYR1_020222 [Brachionus plicatilis]
MFHRKKNHSKLNLMSNLQNSKLNLQYIDTILLYLYNLHKLSKRESFFLLFSCLDIRIDSIRV